MSRLPSGVGGSFALCASEVYMESQVRLSDGKECAVRALGLFELDDVPMEKAPGPFMEEIRMSGGKTVRRPYSPPETPPKKPDFPRDGLREGSQPWQMWLEHDLYAEYLAHRKEEKRIMAAYSEKVKQHILDNCLEPEDRNRVVTLEDWELVNRAAFMALLKEEDIAAALRNNFQG